MKLLKLSLRTRIFISMILLVLGASILILVVTVFQYKEEAESYHKERLDRKEEAIMENIKFVLEYTTYVVNTENLSMILKKDDKIDEMAQVHEMKIYIYDLEGNLLIKSDESFFRNMAEEKIDPAIIKQLDASVNKRIIVKNERDGQKFQSSYTYILDSRFKPLAILYLPYVQDDSLLNRDLHDFLVKMAEVYLFMLLIAIILSFFL